MRYAVISDIHGNLDALEAVLEALEDEQPDEIFCTGDVVGYGAQPGACIKSIRHLGCPVVAGNHDYALCDRMDLEYFNAPAKESIIWTKHHLSRWDVEFLAGLNLMERFDSITLVHSTVHAPALFGYIDTLRSAYLSFQVLKSDICFIGHSHVPVAFLEGASAELVSYSQDPELQLADGQRAIVNCGSVGQPRDEDPRACYIIYDSDQRKVYFRRVEYDMEAAAAKIRDEGLPEILAVRLLFGR